MAFDISTAKPQGFNVSEAVPENQVLPGEELLSTESRALPVNQRQQLINAIMRQQETSYGQDMGATGATQRQQAFEDLRRDDPMLAEQIESLSPAEAASIGYIRGLRKIGRGAASLVGADVFPEVSMPALEALEETRLGAQIGEIAGEAAPFVAAAPLTGTVGTGLQASIGGAKIVPQVTSTAGRAGATGALGAAEGATIAAGEDGSIGDIATGAVLGGTIGSLAEGIPAIRGRTSDQLPQGLIDEGEELLRRSASSKDVTKALEEAAPSIDQLRSASKSLYDSIRAKGVEFDSRFYDNFVSDTLREAGDLGLSMTKAGRTLTPQARALTDIITEERAGPIGLDELENIRRAAQNAAGTAVRAGNNQDAAISNLIVDRIDEFVANAGKGSLTGDTKSVAKELATARRLWGRARKAELLDGALEEASRQASGLENGIRIKFRQILNNKRQKRFFTKNELSAMNDVVEGTAGSNLFKRLGKVGFGTGQQTNVLGGLVGSGVGSATLGNLFGPVGTAIGAVLLPAVGTVSKNLAERLTKNNAALANRLVRAGTDAEKITKAYLNATPKSQRSAEDLSKLLMRPDVDLSLAGSDIAKEAAQLARKERERQAIATAGALGTTAAIADEDNP